jgi:hypothetical protein
MSRHQTRTWISAVATLALGTLMAAAGPAQGQFVGVSIGGPGLVGGRNPYGGIDIGGPGNNYFANPLGGYSIGGPMIGWAGYGWGYPAWGSGYGAYGGWGWGGLGYGVGVSPADYVAYKYQNTALNDARFNLANAQVAEAYQAANLYNQQALATLLHNYRMTAPYEPRYEASGAKKSYDPAAAYQPNIRYLTRDRLIRGDGVILWPPITPTGPTFDSEKQDAERSIRGAVQEYRRAGRVSVKALNEARAKLEAFGRDALSKLKADDAKDVPGFEVFVRSLDRALVSMADLPKSAVSGDIKPDSTPKSAGDVIKDEIKDQSKSAEKNAPRNRPSEDAPKP